jgi:acyl-CoA thioester hydrolase
MRWSDMDAYQHVNNVVYLAYLEEARVDMLFHAAKQMGISALEEGLVVARHEIDYKRPLVYHPDGVDIDVWVTGIGAAHFTLGYVVHDADTIFARAASTLVPFDLAAHRPRRVSEEERSFLTLYLDAGRGADPAS